MNGYGIRVERSDGLTFNYENEDWAILEVSGIDFAKTEIFTEARGFGNGDIVTGKRKTAREINVKLALRKFSQANLRKNRDRLISFHNANLTYAVKITYLGETKIAKDCVIKAASYPSERYRKNPIAELMFLSPEADLFANQTDLVSFVTQKPLWKVTRVYKQGGSLAFGEIEKAREKVINYIGSEPAPIVATIRATGYVEGITIAVGTKALEISTTLTEGDVLIVNAEKKTITKNGVLLSVSEYDAKVLMELMLVYGDNTVTIDSASTAFSSDVQFVGRYGGL